jgi:apolipoprotein D and lipocalin family protein
VSEKRPPLRTVDRVDLPRFMGDWYVQGIIPWFFERHNVGTMDIYELRPDGKINIRYVYQRRSLDAPVRELKATARVANPETNAEWRVQFLWPFEAPFLIIDLADDYRYTVIGYPNRSLVWIMSRQPQIDEKDYAAILLRLAEQGYDTDRIVRVPQP